MFLLASLEAGTTDWEAVLNRWGLPILLLIVVGWAAWKVVEWLAPRFDRLIDSHVDLVETLKTRVGNIEETNEEMKAHVANLARNSEEANRLLRSIDQKAAK
jgi:hypothetical protein